MFKRIVEFMGIDETGKERRCLDIYYEKKIDRLSFAIWSSADKILGCVVLPGKTVLGLVKWIGSCELTIVQERRKGGENGEKSCK